jgi:hypothetical protein
MADPVYAVELSKSAVSAQFTVDGREVVLTAESPRFETTDRYVYLGVRELPFLVDLGEQQKAKGKGGAE